MFDIEKATWPQKALSKASSPRSSSVSWQAWISL